MDLQLVPAGKNPPKDIYAIIEIPLGGVPVKYEFDKRPGALFVDHCVRRAINFEPRAYGRRFWRPGSPRMRIRKD